MPRVRYLDRNENVVEFEVGFGSNLFRAALARSLPLVNGPMRVLHCWGKGYCGACFVEVVKGTGALPERTPVERRKLKDFPENIRLACQVPVTGDLLLRKPRGILRPRLERARPAEAQAAPERATS